MFGHIFHFFPPFIEVFFIISHVFGEKGDFMGNFSEGHSYALKSTIDPNIKFSILHDCPIDLQKFIPPQMHYKG